VERVFDVTPEEIERACQGELPALVLRGLELFNQGEYFEAHEELELAWRAEREPVRELYRGILQIAVAYYHILRGNYPGAVKMFRRSRTWLRPFPGRCRGIDLAAFRVDSGRVEAELLRLGPEGLDRFDRGLIKKIHYTDGEEEA
jgi:predicted metal-dependent hydrolase